MSYSPGDTGEGRARRACGTRTWRTAARAANWAGTFFARRQSLMRCADTRTGRPRSSTRWSWTTASDTRLRGGFPASRYSRARRSAKAVRAPESELKASTPYFPRTWTSGPENSLYTADLGVSPARETGTSSGRASTVSYTRCPIVRPRALPGLPRPRSASSRGTDTDASFGTGPREGRDRCRTTRLPRSRRPAPGACRFPPGAVPSFLTNRQMRAGRWPQWPRS